MTSLSIDYPPGTVPNISVQLETANGRKIVVGEIDSGSDRSLCPRAIAKDLGLSGQNLKKNELKGMPAVGGTFDTWSTDGIAITGQIVLPDPDEGGFVPWGPMFGMDLAFADDAETLLLGQRDFFAAFDLKFLNRDGGSVLELCECPKAPRGP
jgi:hypothetical protein